MKRCTLLLCRGTTEGAVRLNVLQGDVPQTVEAPMCSSCADVLAEAILAKAVPRLTPGGAIYWGNFDGMLPRLGQSA